MGILGTNVRGDGSIPPKEIAELYPNGVVRIVLEKQFEDHQASYFKSLKEHNLKIWGVIAKESLKDFNSVGEAADWYLSRFGLSLDFIQLGNEWDHISESSWTMSVDELYDLVFKFHQLIKGRIPIILGGAVSGDPNAFDRIFKVLPLLDGISIHPYGQRYSENEIAPSGDFGVAERLFDTYVQKLASLGFNLRMFVSEYGVSSDQVGIDSQAKYISGFAMMLRRSTVIEIGIHFCQHNYQGFGVRDKNEKLKAKLLVGLKLASLNQEGETQLPTNPYYFSLGILAKANELKAKGVDVGEPREPETYPFPGAPYSFQTTTTGLFVYSAKANLAHFIKGE